MRSFFSQSLGQIGLLLCALIFISACSISYELPDEAATLSSPVVLDASAIEQAHRFLAEKTSFDAFVALQGETMVARWGEADLPINTHSVRKSLLSALFGIAISKGLISPDASIASFRINEPDQPLTELELSATVRDLLKSRSGIYLEASGETASMRESRPRRGQHDPGEFFYYNNWDFNVLGAIFEQETGMTIGQALDEWIARPTGMTSFRPDHVIYVNESGSQYRQFVIYMSATDLARFGTLYIQGGQWAGQQIIPAYWIEESLTAYSQIPGPKPFDGYGYMWWLDSIDQTAWADGWRGQYMIIDRNRQLVVVSRNDTGRDLVSITWVRLFGKDGFRDHHQTLHRLMTQAIGESTSGASR